MFDKFRSARSNKNDNRDFSYLPEQIQDEIKAAMEATSVYDIP